MVIKKALQALAEPVKTNWDSLSRNCLDCPSSLAADAADAAAIAMTHLPIADSAQTEEIMIALLKGTLAHIDASYGIVDVNGVGYKVFMPSSVLNGYTLGEEATVHITTVVLQDAITLYGFDSALEAGYF